MKTVTENFVHEGIPCSVTGDLFETIDAEELNKFYFGWKDLNDVNVAFNMRRANLPELLSEGLASMLFGWIRTNGVDIRGCQSSSCDLINIDTGELIQLKACSTSADKQPGPTSFGPRSEFDTLIFMHLDCERDEATFYQLNTEEYKYWKVNQSQTIEDQQLEGRRPRVTILPKIKEYGIKPFYKYKFSRDKVKGTI